MESAEMAKCRWPIDDKTSSTFDLPDGRKIGYAQFGDPDGKPVLYLHGFPGGRIEGALLHHDAIRLGLRIIAADRPGMGWSSPHKDRTVLSHVKDLETLADYLKLEKYGVLGISGGGPYALACAWAMPADKLRAVSIVCGMGMKDMGYWGIRWPNYLGWTFCARWAPSLIKSYFGRMPGAQLNLPYEQRMKNLREAFEKDRPKLHPKDARFFGDVDVTRFELRSLQSSFVQGMDGVALDWRLMASDLGFRIEDIRKNLPVQLWYAMLDQNVPLHHGQEIKARIGDRAQLTVMPDDTHASISNGYKQEYLSALADAI